MPNRGRRVTLLDIARELNVAPSTVSNALSGRRYVDEDLVARVKQTAERLGYRPNPVARRLRSGKAGAIGLFSAMPFAVAGGASRLGFMMEIASAAAEEAMRGGMALTLAPPVESMSLPVEDMMIDGALLIEPIENDPFGLALEDRGLPVVRIGRQLGREDAPCVEIPSIRVAEILTAHLDEAGAGRLALIQGASARATNVETAEVYRRHVQARGQEPLIVKIEESSGEEGGRQAALELLRAHPEVDGIMAMVDAFAGGVCRAAAELGRPAPEGLKIVTRYDGPRSTAAEPPVTAVNLRLSEAAQQAVRMLLKMIEENEDPSPARVPGPDPILVPRASTIGR